MSNELRPAVEQLGYPSIAAWAAQAETESFLSLAQRAPVSLSAVALMRLMAEEAHARGDFASIARATFIRMLHTVDVAGAPREGKWHAQVDTLPLVAMFDPEHKPTAERLWSEFADLLERDPDWTPASADDDRLVALFEPHVQEFERSAVREKINAVAREVEQTLLAPGPHELRIASLRTLGRGHCFFHAMRWVDAEVRNGGFEQLYRNTGGAEVADAIEAHRAIGQDRIAALIEESLRYARLCKPSWVHDSVETTPELDVDGTPRTWANLDKAYYAEDNAGADALIRQRGDLFDPPWYVLTHPDGRMWKIRERGDRVELCIELPDGDRIDREIRLGLGEQPSTVIEQRIARQRELGFVDGS